MSKLDKVLIEALLFKDKTPPTRKAKSTLKQLLKEQREEEIELEEYLEWRKAREDKKKPKDDKDKLTFWHKVILLHIGAIGYFATLALLFKLTFH